MTQALVYWLTGMGTLVFAFYELVRAF